MKRFVCDRCKAPIRKWNIVCYSCGYTNTHLARKIKIARELKAVFAIALIVGSIALCNSLLLFPWQRGARRNKQVILEYAEEHYPDARFIEGHYNSAKFFVWNNFGDAGVFNLAGVEFKITAEAGEILIDGYPKARACAQFDKIIQDGFLKPQGLSAQTSYIFVDNYYEIYPYTGVLEVKVKSIDQGSTPREVGWLYDFYKFWKEEGAFLTGYSVHLYIIEDNQMMYRLDYDVDSDFPNETAFYSAFRPG